MAQNKYRDQTGKKTIEIKEIRAANLFDLSPDFITTANSHDAWELVYVNSGRTLSQTEHQSIELTQGQVVFHRPDELHNTICNGRHGAEIFSLIFECDSQKMDYFIGKAVTVPQEPSFLLKKLIEECTKTYEVSKQPLKIRADAPYGGEQIIMNYLEAFLLLMIRRESTDTSVASPAKPESGNHLLANNICDYLHDHLCERVTLDMLSEEFHFGKVYLCDVFKKNIGCSIITYHTDLKITEAKRMLRETDATVLEISDRLGFESPSYFSRCFKSRTGYPPQSFRKMLITSSAAKRR